MAFKKFFANLMDTQMKKKNSIYFIYFKEF